LRRAAGYADRAAAAIVIDRVLTARSVRSGVVLRRLCGASTGYDFCDTVVRTVRIVAPGICGVQDEQYQHSQLGEPPAYKSSRGHATNGHCFRPLNSSPRHEF
jgi:hypothetical protein